MSLVPVDVGAAELVDATEFGLDGGPVLAELEKNRAAAGGVDEGAAGGGLEPGGTTGDGECETALDGVEVRPVGERELELVSEWRANGRVTVAHESNRAEVLDFLQASCSLKRLTAVRWELASRAV